MWWQVATSELILYRGFSFEAFSGLSRPVPERCLWSLQAELQEIIAWKLQTCSNESVASRAEAAAEDILSLGEHVLQERSTLLAVRP